MASKSTPLAPSVTAKNLIQSFEKGEVMAGSEQLNKEKPVSRPGATKKLKQEYEQKGQKKDSPTAQSNAVNGTSKSAPVPKKLKVFIIFAHIERKSYNGALLDAAVDSLTADGHTVEVSDLYNMKWCPTPSKDDFKGNLKDPASFSWPKEAHEAVNKGTLAPDIVAEHAKLMNADLVIFQFPMNWYSFPAILKGYIDRVWTPGFAYQEHQGDFFDKAKFKGKKAMLSFTTGTPESFYQPNSFSGDINVYLWPMNNVLRFVGFDVLPPNIVYAPALVSDEQRKTSIQAWGQRTKQLAREAPLSFIGVDNFSLAAGGYITDKYMTQNVPANDEYGLTIAQHLGKKLPVGSMTGNVPNAAAEKGTNGAAPANGV